MERTGNKSAHKGNSGEENSPAASARISIHNLSIMHVALLPTSCPGKLSVLLDQPSNAECGFTYNMARDLKMVNHASEIACW